MFYLESVYKQKTLAHWVLLSWHLYSTQLLLWGIPLKMQGGWVKEQEALLKVISDWHLMSNGVWPCTYNMWINILKSKSQFCLQKYGALLIMHSFVNKDVILVVGWYPRFDRHFHWAAVQERLPRLLPGDLRPNWHEHDWCQTEGQ